MSTPAKRTRQASAAAAAAAATTMVPVDFNKTFALNVLAEIRSENNRDRFAVAAVTTERFREEVCLGGPMMTCSVAFRTDKHYNQFSDHMLETYSVAIMEGSYEFKIEWPKPCLLECSAVVYLKRGETRWKRGPFDWPRGDKYCEEAVRFGMRSVSQTFLVDNKSFNVYIDVSLKGHAPVDPARLPCPATKMKHLQTLSSDLTHLLISGQYSDVLVKCGDRTFKCHKNILSSRSEVLAAMVSSNFSEGHANIVTIIDIDPDVLYIMLLYVYSGEVRKEDVSVGLFRAAHMYGLVPLSNECCQVLAEHITLENCCEMLDVAHVYEHKHLFTYALDFFKRNKKALIASPDWSRYFTDNSLIKSVVLNM